MIGGNKARRAARTGRIGSLTALATVALSLAGRAPAGDAPPPDGEKPKPDKPVLIRDGKPDLDAILEHYNNLYRSQSSESRATLTIVKPRRTR
ncbi:MAG: hypothetical protein ACYS9X_20965, partial [Planctomycetota bacterium]